MGKAKFQKHDNLYFYIRFDFYIFRRKVLVKQAKMVN